MGVRVFSIGLPHVILRRPQRLSKRGHIWLHLRRRRGGGGWKGGGDATMPRYERAGFEFVQTAERLTFRRTEERARRTTVGLVAVAVWIAGAGLVLASQHVWVGAA